MPPMLTLPFRNLIGQVFRAAEPSRRCLRANLENFLLYVGRERLFLCQSCQGWIKLIRNKKRGLGFWESQQPASNVTLTSWCGCSLLMVHRTKFQLGVEEQLLKNHLQNPMFPFGTGELNAIIFFCSSVFNQLWVGLSCLELHFAYP